MFCLLTRITFSDNRISGNEPGGTASVPNSLTSDSASVQRAVASLSNSEKTRSVPVAALPVTQQMTEMSISREDRRTTPKQSCQSRWSLSPVHPFLSPVLLRVKRSRYLLPELPKPKKNRCFMYRKKVGLPGFCCQCGNLYCGLHPYSDQHNSPYDYKAEAAAKTRKENLVVVAVKSRDYRVLLVKRLKVCFYFNIWWENIKEQMHGHFSLMFSRV